MHSCPNHLRLSILETNFLQISHWTSTKVILRRIQAMLTSCQALEKILKIKHRKAKLVKISTEIRVDLILATINPVRESTRILPKRLEEFTVSNRFRTGKDASRACSKTLLIQRIWGLVLSSVQTGKTSTATYVSMKTKAKSKFRTSWCSRPIISRPSKMISTRRATGS